MKANTIAAMTLEAGLQAGQRLTKRLPYRVKRTG